MLWNLHGSHWLQQEVTAVYLLYRSFRGQAAIFVGLSETGISFFGSRLIWSNDSASEGVGKRRSGQMERRRRRPTGTRPRLTRIFVRQQDLGNPVLKPCCMSGSDDHGIVNQSVYPDDPQQRRSVWMMSIVSRIFSSCP